MPMGIGTGGLTPFIPKDLVLMPELLSSYLGPAAYGDGSRGYGGEADDINKICITMDSCIYLVRFIMCNKGL